MIEAIIKCGGSLTRGDALPVLCRHLAEFGRQHRLLLVPGGGPFADAVREADCRYRLGNDSAHWMAILAMDQYGYLLSDLIPHSQPVRSLQDANEIAPAGRVPVLLPFDLLRHADPLPHDWAVTSDSISAWIAVAAKASRLVLLKDVDGLYEAIHPSGGDGNILEMLTVEQLSRCEGVDPFLASFLRGNPLDLWIINGKEPDRLEELLRKGKTRGTHLRQ